MRLIEEQLTQRHSGLELIKEGQLDARERLLTELEAKARERAETAEAESYRLKGLLSHMESMAISLRGQNGEEKERLRQEHLRLQSLQASIEAERSSLHARGRDDAEESMRRKEEARELLRSAEDERQRFLEEISIQRKKLEIDRAEFSAFVMRSTSASDAAAQSLKEEENRLQRLREDVMEQRNILTQQKAAAMSDLSVASELRREFDVLRREIEFERNEVEQTAAELHRTSELLHAKDEELRAMSMDFASREQVLREGFEKVSSVGDSVLRRETELKYHAQQLGLHQMELDRMDGEMAQRRVSLASSQREALRKNPHYSLTLMSPRQAPAQQTRPQRAHPQTLAIQDQFSNIDSFEEKSSLDMACRKSDAWAILKLNRGVDGAPELKLARKAMASVRTQLGRYAEENKDIRRSTDGLHKVGVDTESSLFVDRLMSKRGL